MNLVILYRGDEFEEHELTAAKKAGFHCTNSRMEIPSYSLVTARYSCLPYYKELEVDLAYNGSRLINTYKQHRYIADLQNWYEDLKKYTPATWREVVDIPYSNNGPFVLKGETNSKKHLWSTHMFAKTRGDIGRVMGNLLDDSLIKDQNIYIREHEPFVTFAVGINDLPITKEFRFFMAYGEILSGGYYWSSNLEDIKDKAYPGWDNPESVPVGFLKEVVDKVKNHANGVVIDVAQHVNGDWRVVELNDLQMSGLSENDPEILYKNLFRVLSSRSLVQPSQTA